MVQVLSKRRILRGAACLVLLAGMTASYLLWMSGRVMNEWRRSHGSPSDCAIVLGAAVWNGKPSTALRERLDVAVQVYETGLAGHLILSGGVGAGDTVSEALVMKHYLMSKGIPEQALLLEEDSHSTLENLHNSRKLMADNGFTSAVLVTHGFHALRARMQAADMGIEATVEPVQITPLDLRYYVLREDVGIAYYEVKQWLGL